MSQITTHVLDTALGKPAAGIEVRLLGKHGDQWRTLGAGTTDSDGRITTLLAADTKLPSGDYRLIFDTGAYHRKTQTSAFYPHIQITFTLDSAGAHHHIPLLLNPFGYSTYRGS